MKSPVLIMCLLFAIKVSAQIDTVVVQSAVTDVSVFLNGAQVTRTGNVTVKKGKQILLIDTLPESVSSQSIQVEKIPFCSILSVKHSKKQPNLPKRDKKDELELKISALEMKIKETKNKLIVLQQEEQLLMDNSVLGKEDKGPSISAIREAADFYRSRLNDIRHNRLLMTTELQDDEEALNELQKELNIKRSVLGKSHGQVAVAIDCEREGRIALKVSYYISAAGWVPQYDFRVEDITSPLKIVYNARVYQSSGEAWNNVNLKLTTNNPSLSGEKPALETWYLGRTKRKVTLQDPGQNALQGRVLDASTQEPLPFATAVLTLDGELIASGVSDFDGVFLIKPLPSGNYNLSCSYVGYIDKVITGVEIRHGKSVYQEILMSKKVIEMQEVEIVNYKVPLVDKFSSSTTITREDITPGRQKNAVAASAAGVFKEDVNLRGNRNDPTDYFIDGVKQRERAEINYISNSIKNNVSNLEYAIDIPYTILSDGRDNAIRIKEAAIPVKYVYNIVPKLDNAAFLTAEISGWEELNLLSGKSSIYYQGTFTGESELNADDVADTLILSLGRDRNIVVKREGIKSVNDKRVIGSNVKETVGWDIKIKNNKSADIYIVVEDQYPVSERKSLEVELLDSGGAKTDSARGKLTWQQVIPSGETVSMQYRYAVKYPKDLFISVE